MAEKNHYEVLGVDPAADDDEIKRAYRKLVREWHPDVNANSDEANEVFREIKEAHTVLSNPQQRKEYDKRLSREGIGFGANVRFSRRDIFDEIFNGVFRDGMKSGGWFEKNRNASSNSTVRIQIPMSLSELLNGVTRTIKVPKVRACEDCGGKGLKNDICPDCGGAGYASSSHDMRDVCSTCRGAGRTSAGEPCDVCGGRGYISEDVDMDIEIPPGINVKPLIIQNAGNQENLDSPSGHLIIVPKVQLPPDTTITGGRVMMTVRIDPVKFMIGGSQKIKTPFGDTVRIDMDSKSQFNHIRAVSGMGLPTTFGSNDTRDELLLKLIPELPNHITEEQHGLLEQYIDAKQDEGTI